MKVLGLLALILTVIPFVEAQQRTPDVLRRLRMDDQDGDGRVTREEFSGASRLFDRFDLNGDGAVTREEVQSLAGRRRAQRQPLRVPEDVEVIRDVVYGRGKETHLKLDIIRPKDTPEKPMPVLVWVHGGGWRGGSKASGIRRLIPFAQKGYFCATIDYRLSGEAVFPAQIEDCKCAIRYLRAHAGKYNLDPERIGVWGSSAGGHLAALLGTSGDVKELEGKGGWATLSSRVQAVCDWYGPSDLLAFADLSFGRTDGRREENATARARRRGSDAPARLLGGPIHENRDRAVQASPVSYVTKDDPPFLIMHGTDDRTVPHSQSLVLKEALEKAGVPVKLVTLQGAGHGGPQFNAPETRRQVMAFFDKHLPGQTAEADPSSGDRRRKTSR